MSDKVTAEQAERTALWLELPRRVLLLLAAFALAAVLVLALRGLTPGAGGGRPVAELLVERAPLSVGILLSALVLAGLLALALAAAGTGLAALRGRAGLAGMALSGAGRLAAYALATAPVFVVLLFAMAAVGLGGQAGRAALAAGALALLPALLAAQAGTRAWQTAGGQQSKVVGLLAGLAALPAQTGGLISALVVAEMALALPGLGSAAVQAVMLRDAPLAAGALLAFAGLTLAGRLAAAGLSWLPRWLGRARGPARREAPAAAPPAPGSTAGAPAVVGWRTRPLGLALALSLLLLPALLMLGGLATDEQAAMQNNIRDRSQGSSFQYPLGTDGLGRDVLARSLRGGLASLSAAAGAALLAFVPAAVGGLAAGWLTARRRWWSEALADAALLPAEALALLPAIPAACFWLLVAGGQPLGGVALLVGLLVLPRATRAARAMRAAPASAVSAARPAGSAAGRVASVLGGLLLGSMFTALWLGGMLDFLGLGIPPPTPSLGAMVAQGAQLLNIQSLEVGAPGMLLWLCGLALFTAADAVMGRLERKGWLALNS